MTTTAKISICALALLGLAACGKTLDPNSVQTSITGAFKKKDITLKTVTCPAGKAAKANDTFDCEATTPDGDKTTIKVTQKDDQGNLTFVSSPALYNQKTVGEHMGPKLGAGVTVKCPDKTGVSKKDDKFTCDMTTASGPGKIEITAKDGEANFHGKGKLDAVAAADKPAPAMDADDKEESKTE